MRRHLLWCYLEYNNNSSFTAHPSLLSVPLVRPVFRIRFTHPNRRQGSERCSEHSPSKCRRPPVQEHSHEAGQILAHLKATVPARHVGTAAFATRRFRACGAGICLLSSPARSPATTAGHASGHESPGRPIPDRPPARAGRRLPRPTVRHGALRNRRPARQAANRPADAGEK